MARDMLGAPISAGLLFAWCWVLQGGWGLRPLVASVQGE